ncbi:MAG: hypothetical protein DMF63_07570 [Acidobacteria bacterium]|nr:MAG: hypothetical protein DMF63_07570 [Acidobacteriota bacterium]
MKISFSGATTLLILFLFIAIATPAQDLTAEQIIAKHVESIGPKDKLDAVKNQLIFCDATFTFKGAVVTLNGKALVLSEGQKNLFGMNFNSNDYPVDRFGFDGKDVKVGRPTTGSSHSLIGDFLYNNRSILKEGIFGGTLSASWPLLASERKAKISVEGKKTMDGKNLIGLSYVPKSAADVTIKLYFDETTFRHVRTEYTVVRPASIGTGGVDSSARQSSTTYRVYEDFSDFTKMGALTLPKNYKITYIRSGSDPVTIRQHLNRDAEWKFTVTNINFNQALEPGSFSIDG